MLPHRFRRLHHHGRREVMPRDPLEQVRRHALVETDGTTAVRPHQLVRDRHRHRPAEWAIPQSKRRRFRPHRTTHVHDGAVELRQRSPRALEQHRPCRGELHAPRRAHEQHDAQVTLELPNRPRQGRLRHVQPRRSPPEMELLRHRDEVPQLPELDGTVHAADTDPHRLPTPGAITPFAMPRWAASETLERPA